MNATTLPTPAKVALAFAQHLHATLADSEMLDVLVSNRHEPSSIVCHSHDFCDANMVMDAAMRSLGVDPLPEGQDGMPEAVQALWNEAWEIAKDNEFDPISLHLLACGWERLLIDENPESVSGFKGPQGQFFPTAMQAAFACIEVASEV